MKRAVLRSFVFDLLFYLLVGLECVICLPFLLLPRRYFMGVVHGFVNTVFLLEKYVLGLTYEVRGLENLPESGSFIVAAKHQSPYETMKLHRLFKDPAVILKKELLSIPLWGMYLKKSDVIAIDRSTPDMAIQSIQDGARRMAAQGRPIVIFPQGTRVSVDQTSTDKPYKIGVARIQEATGLPIVPLAMNSGMFWPRSGFLKSGGTVVFKFLEPVVSGKDRKILLKELEDKIEGESLSLMNEAKEKSAFRKFSFLGLWAFLILLFGGYSVFWFKAAGYVRSEYIKIAQKLNGNDLLGSNEFSISGYPFKIKLEVPVQKINFAEGSAVLHNLKASGWPVPFFPVHVESGLIEVSRIEWKKPLSFDLADALFTVRGDVLTVQEGVLKQGEFIARVTGMVNLAQKPVPEPDLIVSLRGHSGFLKVLEDAGVVDTRASSFANAALGMLTDKDGNLSIPITQKEGQIYAGPLPLMRVEQ